MAEDPIWPSFLDLLDADPDAAFARFYEHAMIVLTARPPRMFSGMTAEEREDCLHDIIYHCVKNGFRVLRLYQDQGKPFSAWLYSVAHHKSFDCPRSRTGGDFVSIDPGSEEEGARVLLSDPGPESDEPSEWGEVVDIARRMIQQLGDHCRLLLQLAADEFTIKEMVVVLGLPADQNKKISGDLSYCRDKLWKRLAEEGYTPESLGLRGKKR